MNKNKGTPRDPLGKGADCILILQPTGIWDIVTAQLKRVESPGEFMIVTGSVRSIRLSEDSPGELRQLAGICESMTLEELYGRFANKKIFHHAKDFWECKEATVRNHLKNMADQRLTRALDLAFGLDIPVIYRENEKAPLHLSQRLLRNPGETAVPLMGFSRHETGTDYRLKLRIGEYIVEQPCYHQMKVLCFSPALLVIDGRVCQMSEGFSGKLLKPFITKDCIHIDRRMENEYFRRFILKNISKAEVHAEGFDIEDVRLQPQPSLRLEQTVGGHYVLTLWFAYGSMDYTAENKAIGKVALEEQDGGFRFTRHLRDRQEERRFTEILLTAAPETFKAGQKGCLHFDTLKEAIAWLRLNAPGLRQQGFDIVQPSEHIYYIGSMDVEQSEEWQGDWLQTDVTVVLDNGRTRIPFADLRETILSGEQEYMLPNGERLLIPEEWLQRYGELLLIGRKSGGGLKRHKSQTSQPQEDARHDRSITHHSSRTTPHALPASLKANLRPYQQKGYEWLWGNFIAQTGCCLADEMGLGKTVQTIAMLLEYKETSRRQTERPQEGFLFTDEEMLGASPHPSPPNRQSPTYLTSLIVAPASVTHNWRNELLRFAPSLLVCDYTGETEKRREKRQVLMRWDIVVTTYRTLTNDIDFLSQKEFGIVVFDESQAFKTATSQIHQAVKRLKAIHRVALSGTPVENNLGELWSLMNVLNPELLGDRKGFQRAFENPIAQRMEQQRICLLGRLIAPYFLKRTKEEVLNDLPERQDEVVVCPMTESQASQYASELSKARNEYLDSRASAPERNIHILAALQRLRQIANGEGKMEVIFERLDTLRQSRHKVLLFSEYVGMLRKVEERMKRLGWSYEMLTGETQQRERVISRFQNSSDCQFFLISLKAGGVGLNLTAADYVFLIDPWWNLAAEEQAIARAHRIGQHQPVFVYRFVSEKTLEQQILTLQERKQNLIDSVMPFINQSLS